METSPREADATPDGDNDTTVLPVMRVISMLNACRDVNQYEKLNMISQGTYGIVYRCASLVIALFLPLLQLATLFAEQAT